MTGIFDHIVQSDKTDPFRFFRGITDADMLQRAIDFFMPIKIQVILPNGSTNFLYEPDDDYIEVDYSKNLYVKKCKDLDYKPLGADDPSEFYKEEKYSFFDVVSNKLNIEVELSKHFVKDYFLQAPENIFERREYLINDLADLKKKPAHGLYANLIINALANLEVLLIDLTNSPSFQESTSTRKKKDRLPKIVLQEIFNQFELHDKKWDVENLQFINWFYEFNSSYGSLPTTSLHIKLSNKKAIYYLLTKVHAILPFDYKLLEESRLLEVNETLFEHSFIDEFPYDKRIKKWQKIIDDVLDNNQ